MQGISTTYRPHLIALLADDLGYFDTAIHNAASPTPSIARLAKGGLRLDRHYVFRFCSPSRRSFLTGRLPTSITTVQPDGARLCSDFLPLATQLLSEKLAAVGYRCHFVGKGHLGYQTTDHLPFNRGFESHIGYLGGAEAYSHGGGSPDPSAGTHDLWRDDRPAVGAVRGMHYSADYYSRSAVDIIEAHGRRHSTPTAPLFLYFAIQNVHSPYTLPPKWQVRHYPKMGEKFHIYANMLAALDGAVANVTRALRGAGMWDDTLLLFSSDNGGIGEFGNNYPLRGHKHDPWEGGTRAVAFLAGGALPQNIRASSSRALVHISDWYPTFCVLAGASPIDDAFVSGKIRPIDGVDVWPMLTGVNVTQPRMITVVTEVSAIEVVGGGVDGDALAMWKLVTLAGQSNRYDERGNQLNSTDRCLEGRQPDPPQPGRTDPIVNGPASCERAACPVCNQTNPCLYELVKDPSEIVNRASDLDKSALIVRLASSIVNANMNAYVNGTLDAGTLEREYEHVDAWGWKGFAGPCYKRKTERWNES
mmetsp:Transcript_30802/g.50940  ORF Transcript_30802/g.50940 Transcript_30802/m.50940 type:complete len:533 (+) Transcript_30802:57-1655(+)